MVIEIIGDTTNQTKAVTRELWIEGRRFSGGKKKKKLPQNKTYYVLVW